MTSANRKLTTIFYADVAGYSRLTGDDELDTHQKVMSALDFANETIAAKGGTVLRYAGDAILAEFSSVVASVDASVEIQKELEFRNEGVQDDKRVQLRIGINLGEVLSDRGEIYGDGVNIAARLESIALPGGICISHKVGAEIDGKVDVSFLDGGAYQLKNIKDPMRVMHWHPDEAVEIPQGEHFQGKDSRVNTLSGNKILIPVIVAIAVLSVTGAGWFFFREPPADPIQSTVTLEVPDEPSVAVLPFKPIGKGETIDYFSDGITSDLITDLSRFHGLFVSASNSTFSYRDGGASLKQAAEELGVRYVLEGSAQQAANRVRVNVELVEAATGKRIWTQRYDRELSDLFAVQDDIVRELVSNLTGKMDEVELKRSLTKRPSSLKAYDYVLRGQNLLRNENRADNFESQRMFQLAIEQDPGYAVAYTGLGSAVLQATADGWMDDPREGLNRAHDLAEAAIAIESHPGGYALLGRAYLLMRHFDLSLEELNRAIELNPNDADSYAALGMVNLWTSNLDQSIESYETSIRLDPMAPADVFTGFGIALFLKQDYHGALAKLKSASAKKPEDLLTQAALAATFTRLDRSTEANKAAESVRKLHPFFDSAPYRNAFLNPEHGQLFADALVSAGLD